MAKLPRFIPARQAHFPQIAAEWTLLPTEPRPALPCVSLVGSQSRNPFRRRRRAMFIELARADQGSFRRTGICPQIKAAYRSYAALSLFIAGFYRHVAPAALWIGFRILGVFRQTVSPPSLSSLPSAPPAPSRSRDATRRAGASRLSAGRCGCGKAAPLRNRVRKA